MKGIAGIVVYILCLGVLFPAIGDETTDVYELKMSLHVPRTYNNTTSQGYRSYQVQCIKGDLHLTYSSDMEDEFPVVFVTNLVNYTQKVCGENIRYACTVDDDVVYHRVNLIGSNKKGVFKVPSIVFFLDAEPNYSLGEDDEDNSLLVTLAGSGKVRNCKCCPRIYSLSGMVAGTLGCGCKAYGHISPTRVAAACGASDIVDDVASVYGKWTAVFKKRVVKTVKQNKGE